MAVTVQGRTYKMVAADVLNYATLQPNAGATAGPYRVRATLIVVCAVTAAAVVLTNAGVATWTFTPAANSMTIIAGSDPMELDDFTVTTLTDGYVIVFATL